MTNTEKIRDLIGDKIKSSEVTLIGDGVKTIFQMPKTNLITDSVTVSAGSISDVDYSTGMVTLSTAVADGVGVQFTFKYAGFRDEEITEYLSEYSTIKKTAIALIDILLADSARRYDYSTGLEEYKPSQVFEQLSKLRDKVKESDNDLGASGGAKMLDRTSNYGDLDNSYE